MSNILEKVVSDVVAHLARTLEQGANDGTIASLEDPRASAEMLYYMWLGASLVASISHSDAPLNSAMDTTRALLPAP